MDWFLVLKIYLIWFALGLGIYITHVKFKPYDIIYDFGTLVGSTWVACKCIYYMVRSTIGYIFEISLWPFGMMYRKYLDNYYRDVAKKIVEEYRRQKEESEKGD